MEKWFFRQPYHSTQMSEYIAHKLHVFICKLPWSKNPYCILQVSHYGTCYLFSAIFVSLDSLAINYLTKRFTSIFFRCKLYTKCILLLTLHTLQAVHYTARNCKIFKCQTKLQLHFPEKVLSMSSSKSYLCFNILNIICIAINQHPISHFMWSLIGFVKFPITMNNAHSS